MGGPQSKDPVERFMSFIEFEPNTGCWLWTGGTNRSGHGRFRVGSRIDNTSRKVQAHRFSYETFIGPIPNGFDVLHKCDISCCENPDHFFLGLPLDNCDDMAKKGRGIVSKKGLPFGASLQGSGRYKAQIGFKGKLFYGGTHDTPEEASKVALQLKKKLREVPYGPKDVK